MSLLFNQTCLLERLLPIYTHTRARAHTYVFISQSRIYIYTYIYIYIYIYPMFISPKLRFEISININSYYNIASILSLI